MKADVRQGPKSSIRAIQEHSFHDAINDIHLRQSYPRIDLGVQECRHFVALPSSRMTSVPDLVSKGDVDEVDIPGIAAES